MMRIIGFYFLSLWLLFVLIFIITADIPICFCKDSTFVGFKYLFLKNIIPLCSIAALLIGVCSYLYFFYLTKGTKELSFEIKEIESIHYPFSMLQFRKFTIYCCFRYITFCNWLYIYPYRYFLCKSKFSLTQF